MYSIDDLTRINEELLPLKLLADRELASIYGLTGLVYTPHIDSYNKVSINKARILLELKTNGLISFTDVEVISAKLMVLHRRVKNLALVDYDGSVYECRYAPLKLSKSGKVVRKWAKYWLKKLVDGETDPQWQSVVKEVWPEYFLIKDFER